MRPLSDFYSRILPWVPGCPEPTANQALVDAAILFCEDSLVLREKLEPFQLEVGKDAYELDAPAQQQVARVLSAQIDGYACAVVPAEDSVFPMVVTGKPTAVYTTRSGSEFLLHTNPIPDAAYWAEVQVALRPLRTATQLEDDLFNLWAEAVVSGAVSRICSIPNQPFTDLATSANAAMHAARWSNKARIEGSSNRTRGQLSVQQRPLA
jgi:hypothetical protein